MDLPLPAYQTDHAAGMDLLAAVLEPMVLGSMERAAVPCGFAMKRRCGFEAQSAERGRVWRLKQGVGVVNAPGTIDADYRGEVKVLLVNFGKEAVTITRGMRIAQMVICPVTRGAWEEVKELPSSERGSGGFGSTGH